MSAILSLWYLAAAFGSALAYRLLAPWVGRTGRALLLSAISAVFLWRFLNLSAYGPQMAVFVAGLVALATAMPRVPQRWRPLPLFVGIALVVATMLEVKYPHFTGWALGALPRPDLLAVEWLGLSYLSFRAVDMLLVARSPYTARVAAADGLAYLLFFPPFISGPINRFGSFVQDLDAAPPALDRTSLRNAVFRFSWGVVKVVALSRLAWYWSMPTLPADLSGIGAGQVLLSIYAYFLYIFFEFSGYCDIVIVIAILFGVRVPENFVLPLTARNIQEFWNRWHISLSQWCRDHIFFPLVRALGLRLRWLPTLLASMVSIVATFLFIGVWHGDALNWVYYGLYHGLGLSLWMVWREALSRLSEDAAWALDSSPTAHVIGTALTLNFVSFGLLLTVPMERAGVLLSALLG